MPALTIRTRIPPLWGWGSVAAFWACCIWKLFRSVWGSVYDVRDLLNATVKLRDGKKATDMDMGFMEKMAVKKALGKIEGTDIEKLLKEYGVI